MGLEPTKRGRAAEVRKRRKQVQRRLVREQVDVLVAAYQAGLLLDELASAFGVDPPPAANRGGGEVLRYGPEMDGATSSGSSSEAATGCTRSKAIATVWSRQRQRPGRLPRSYCCPPKNEPNWV